MLEEHNMFDKDDVRSADLFAPVRFGGGGGGGGGGGSNPNMRQMTPTGTTYSPHHPGYGPPNYGAMSERIGNWGRAVGWAAASTVPASRAGGFAVGVAGAAYEGYRAEARTGDDG